MKRSRFFIIISLSVLALLLFTLPYKMVVEQLLKDKLLAQGLNNIHFNVDSVGMSSIVINNISFDVNNPISIDQLTVDYSLSELISGQFKNLVVKQVKFKTDAAEITANNINLVFAPTVKPQSWQGSWTVAALTIEKTALPLPPLAGSGNFSADRSALNLDGEFKDQNTAYKTTFTVDYALDTARPSQLQIISAYLPWNEGLISLSNVNIPLAGNKPYHFVVQLQRVSLDVLMQLLTAKRAKATGVVTGAIPIFVDETGELTIQSAELKAEKSGIISLAPDAIPGDNEQVELVRNVLANFHYINFSLGLSSDEDKKLSMLLQLSGNNPEVYNGKEIKLNVRLNGDLLNLLKQNILPTLDPKQFLKEKDHATP